MLQMQRHQGLLHLMQMLPGGTHLCQLHSCQKGKMCQNPECDLPPPPPPPPPQGPSAARLAIIMQLPSSISVSQQNLRPNPVPESPQTSLNHRQRDMCGRRLYRTRCNQHVDKPPLLGFQIIVILCCIKNMMLQLFMIKFSC